MEIGLPLVAYDSRRRSDERRHGVLRVPGPFLRATEPDGHLSHVRLPTHSEAVGRSFFQVGPYLARKMLRAPIVSRQGVHRISEQPDSPIYVLAILAAESAIARARPALEEHR